VILWAGAGASGPVSLQVAADCRIRATVVRKRLRARASADKAVAVTVLGLRAGRRYFTGERDDVPTVLSALDIILVPSWEESFRRSLLEAMAMGRPVIATNVGGPREIVTSGFDGLLLPPRLRPDLWAEAVGSLLTNPERRSEIGRRERSAQATSPMNAAPPRSPTAIARRLPPRVRGSRGAEAAAGPGVP
jgi:glycosyltransferase involved in cell wall biosynthesis